MRITLVKSKGDSHTLESWATKPTLNRSLKLQPKVNRENRPHAVCKSSELFRHGAISRVSRWKIGRFDSRRHRFIKP